MRHNREKIIILILSAVCILTALVVLDRTILNNSGIRLSKASGFYDEEFYLEISGNMLTKIYYTLDGTAPKPGNESTYEYTEPVKIKDATNNKNVYSMRTDSTPYLNDELMAKYGKKENPYILPDYLIDKCNVLRAAMFDISGKLIDEKTAVYFVGFNNKSGYDGLYTVSLSTDSDNLFDYETGIYVTGKAMDEFYDFENRGEWDWNANYYGKGSDWEKPGHIAIFDSNREALIEDDIRMRIQGGSTRSNLQKSFNIYPRDEKGEHSQFSCDLFGNGFNTDKIKLASGGNDYRLKIKDFLITQTDAKYNSSDIHNKMIPANVFLNGEYWGVYYLTDCFTKRYMSNICETSQDNIVYIKNGKVELGEEKDIALYELLTEFMDSSDLSDKEEYKKLCDIVDIESFVNYYATQLYINNIDYLNNYVLWRTKTSNAAGLSDGRWRFVLFDLNHTTSMESPKFDMISYAAENDKIFASVYNNEEFRKLLIDKMYEFSTTQYSYANVVSFTGEYETLMKSAIINNEKRFFDGNFSDFHMGLAHLNTFFKERPLYVEKKLQELH